MEQNSCLEFMLSLCPSWKLQLFAPWPPTSFSAATALCSAPCLCRDFSFISHEVFLAQDSGECLGLMLGSNDDVARLWSWGPGQKVHHGAHLPCSGESASYWVMGPDPACALVKPFNVNDPCHSEPWRSLETVIFPSNVCSRGLRFLGDLPVDLASHLLKKPGTLCPPTHDPFSPWIQSHWENKPKFIFLFSTSSVALVHLTFFLLMDAVILYFSILNPAH